MEHIILIGSLIVAVVFLWRKLIQGDCTNCCTPKAEARRCTDCTSCTSSPVNLAKPECQLEHQPGHCEKDSLSTR